MPTNILALYDEERVAQQALGQLAASGCRQDDLTLVPPRRAEMAGQLDAWGVGGQEAELYAEAVRRGKSLLRARVDDEAIDRVAGILVSQGARRLPEVREELARASGSLQSAQEDLVVGKGERSAEVVARATVSEHPVERQVTLKEEQVRAHSRPADRPLSPDEAAAAFREESVEMTESREVPEVSKQARVTQEVHLEKNEGQREETVRENLRRKDIHLERRE